MKGKCMTTIGSFPNRAAADQAIEDLKNDGFKESDIGLIWRKPDGETVKTDGSGMTSSEKGAATGAAVGITAGAATGAAVTAGILAGVIPVIGPVLALGTLGVTLVNAAGGAAAGGLAGALLGYGIAEDDAKYYEGELVNGRYLVTVNCGNRRGDADRVYARHGGFSRTPSHDPALSA